MTSKLILVVTNKDKKPRVDKKFYKFFSSIVIRGEGIYKNADSGGRGKVYDLSNISDPFSKRYGSSKYFDVSSALRLSLSIPHTFFILDRMSKSDGLLSNELYKSSFNSVAYVLEGLLRSYDIVSQSKADGVVFTSTPHDFESWMIFLTAASNGMKIYTVSSSALPWRACLKEVKPDLELGYKVCKNITLTKNGEFSSLSLLAKKYIDNKRKKYIEAEPRYMKEQKKIREVGSFKKISRALFNAKFNDMKKNELILRINSFLLHLIEKNKRQYLSKCLKKLNYSKLPEGSFVVFFLHFQPERTSIPEGGRYSQQLFAIEYLREKLPKSWALVVKEHPSTFILKKYGSFRSPYLYKKLGEMDRVIVVDPSIESFDLIDTAMAVATLTGTVGFEAICRSVPAIVFGDASYKNYPGVVNLSDNDELLVVCDIEQNIAKQKEKLNQPYCIEKYSEYVENNTVFGENLSCNSEKLSTNTMTEAVMKIAEIHYYGMSNIEKEKAR